MTFGLNRLTAILALTFETDDATVKAEKGEVGSTDRRRQDDRRQVVRHHAWRPVGRPQRLPEPSETITLSYEAGSEPTAASFKAYFNVPAATYGKLSVVITTEGHTASLDLTTDGIELLPGELAYTTKAVSGWTALAAAPTLEWVDNPTFEPQEIKAGMSVKVNLQAAAGIEGFVIKVDSKRTGHHSRTNANARSRNRHHNGYDK